LREFAEMFRETRVSFNENGMFQLTKGKKIMHLRVIRSDLNSASF